MNIKIKDIIKFGQYNWQVLGVHDNKALLLLDGLLKKPRWYHDKKEPVTWETCKLREWLNNKWLNRKFNAREQDCILEVINPNNDNPEYKTDGGYVTEDKVFLLSIDEYELYKDIINNAASWWWLRSPGIDPSFAANVDFDGYLFLFGSLVSWSGVVGGGVRPALWLNLESYRNMGVQNEQKHI